MIEGHASPRLISKANVCVESWTYQTKSHTRTAKQQRKEAPTPKSRKGCVERKRLREKGLRVRLRRKGARAAIGKKRADGQKCSHDARQPPSRQGHFKQQNKRLAKLDMRVSAAGPVGKMVGEETGR